MHFSASVVSALHMDPSAGVILIILCRLFMPMPQLALHSSHSPHSVTRQLLGAIQNGQRKLFANRSHEKKNGLGSAAATGWILQRWIKYLQHSSFTTHFSVSSVGTLHIEPSSGNCFTYLSLDRVPIPQETLQGDHVIQSDIMQVEPSKIQRTISIASINRIADKSVAAYLYALSLLCCLSCSVLPFIAYFTYFPL